MGYTRDLASASENISSGDDCDIDIKTHLKSVQSSIAKYSIGDVLIVQLDDLKRIIAIGNHGLCGIISPINVVQLKNCITKGKEYIAVVTDIGATHCEVRVKLKL